MRKPTGEIQQRWLSPGARGIGTASSLADIGHQISTALPLEFFGLALAVGLTASLEHQQLRVPRECLEGRQQVTCCPEALPCHAAGS